MLVEIELSEAFDLLDQPINNVHKSLYSTNTCIDGTTVVFAQLIGDEMNIKSGDMSKMFAWNTGNLNLRYEHKKFQRSQLANVIFVLHCVIKTLVHEITIV